MPRSTLDADLTQDDFLGGRLKLWQPRRGYRAGVDPVLLAAAVPARAGESALELGCGVGTALLCLNARVPGLDLNGVEVLPDYAELARRNAGDAARIITADLTDLPQDLRQRQFDHVMMNPPYFDRAEGDAAADAGRDRGRAGATPLMQWLDVGCRRLAPKGRLTLIQHITRLPEVLGALQGRLGGLVLRPIQPRTAQPPGLFLLQGRLDARTPFAMAPPLVMHEGTAHTADLESYRPEVQAILRDAAPLPIDP